MKDNKLKLADADVRTAGKVQPVNNEQTNLEKQNTHTLMQALHGGRKNCRECKIKNTQTKSNNSKL